MKLFQTKIFVAIQESANGPVGKEPSEPKHYIVGHQVRELVDVLAQIGDVCADHALSRNAVAWAVDTDSERGSIGDQVPVPGRVLLEVHREAIVHQNKQESQGYSELGDDKGGLETDKGVGRHEEQDERLLVCFVKEWLGLPEYVTLVTSYCST